MGMGHRGTGLHGREQRAQGTKDNEEKESTKDTEEKEEEGINVCMIERERERER